ncbi:MAG: hypothetical protein WC770_03980 [Phycisphaerae bacterium]
MANCCYNKLEIHGSRQNIEKLQKFITLNEPVDGEQYDLGKILPLETDSDEEAREKWGTYWFAGIDFENHGEEAMLSFDSAWSPALPITLEMSKKFNLRIDHYYDEPGMFFEGNYVVENGDVITDDEREFRPACTVCGIKHELEDLIHDEEEGENYCRKCHKEKTQLK